MNFDPSTARSTGFPGTSPARWGHLVALALLLTGLNALKPPVVDDGYFLRYAQHIAAHPLEPYGFDLCSWDWREPAMTQICPPVLPYWLALGIRLFGPHVPALKLTLF